MNINCFKLVCTDDTEKNALCPNLFYSLLVLFICLLYMCVCACVCVCDLFYLSEEYRQYETLYFCHSLFLNCTKWYNSIVLIKPNDINNNTPGNIALIDKGRNGLTSLTECDRRILIMFVHEAKL